jgi:hypothetical protein
MFEVVFFVVSTVIGFGVIEEVVVPATVQVVDYAKPVVEQAIDYAKPVVEQAIDYVKPAE